MYTPYPYQKEAIERAVRFLSGPSKHNAIEVLPTGSGKSLVIAGIAKELEGKTIVFQPTKEILEQNLNKIYSYGVNATVYSASLNKKELSDLTYATIGSVKNLADTFNDFGIKNIIVDECHYVNPKKGMYKELFEQMKGVKILGLTATPYRLTNDGWGGSILKFITRTRPRVFQKVLYYVQNGDLFRDGYLCPLKYYQFGDFNRSKLKFNSTGSDYSDDSVQQYFDFISFESEIVHCVKRLIKAGRNGVLIFTPYIKESEYVVSNVPGAQIVTGETPNNDRAEIITAFRKGQIPAICNVGVLTHGFDYPELDTVVIARPTASLSLYYQMVGRAVRRHPNKKEAWIIDMCKNTELFGRVEDLRLKDEGNGKWVIHNGKRQLTNKYIEEMITGKRKKNIFAERAREKKKRQQENPP